MPTWEPEINIALAELLRKTHRAWEPQGVILSENTSTIRGTQAQPDILVIESLQSPVAVETELAPARTVESEALSRLGCKLRNHWGEIGSSIALRVPTRFREKQGRILYDGLVSAFDLEMALYTGKDVDAYKRWPVIGWIAGGIFDLSLFIQAASVPPEEIDIASEKLVNGILDAASLVESISTINPEDIHKISVNLCQEDGVQTRRMAMTILANAFVFHDTLAGGPGGLSEVIGTSGLREIHGSLRKDDVIDEWQKILAVNYWPIFHIACQILSAIPKMVSASVIDILARTASDLLENHLMRSHDLTGAIFQQLIADRKFLAAY